MHFFSHLLQAVFPQSASGQATAMAEVLAEDKFGSVLARERARADRNGHVFSLAVFDVANKVTWTRDAVSRLVEKITNQSRITDEVGWFGKGKLGVVLFNCLPEGAWTFVENVRQELPGGIPSPRCLVYTYPDGPAESLPGHGEDKAPEKKPRDSENGHGLAKASSGCHSLRPLFTVDTPSWKKAFDFVVSSILLVVLGPILLLIALAVRCSSPGPVLFRQQRAGLGGKPFTCLKFRSMYEDAEARKKELLQYNERSGPVFKMADDPRITPVGRFLRQWSLDELPQLINVWLGDMTLVGPRPPILNEVGKYKPWHNCRLEVKPGITCIWQVYARDERSFDNWVRLDIRYRRKRSPWLDLKLLLLTIPAVLSRRGAC